ncbi:TetR family transcriptional regulator [Jatrophihabitans sp. GAS493]|uniref:TetR/AcrR family transcriptional regulator n=1 Tax=Jatrophihabitans sp. GAS493 TaxID=1907575 RepID=UPI000BB6DA7C|nr:TetR/AcrR family transcriptional regulator [Jatrophihabitans sp. GAS493]SOD71721.1 TetR family transcriptional regulator [Jatrophihabitans sp. GAS493]
MPRSTWVNLDEQRRERVLLAAMSEFGRRGYSGGSLNVIAREAGVAKGSLFQYFEDKFDLFAHIAEHVSLSIYAALAPHLDRAEAEPGAGHGAGDGAGDAASDAFLETFTRLVEVWIDYMSSHPLERGVTAATNFELDPAIRLAVREPVHRLYAQALRPLFADAIARGELAEETDVDALLSITILLLPHLALAPFEPGLDSALVLYGTTKRVRTAHARRLVAVVISSASIGVAS